KALGGFSIVSASHSSWIERTFGSQSIATGKIRSRSFSTDCWTWERYGTATGRVSMGGIIADRASARQITHRRATKAAGWFTWTKRVLRAPATPKKNGWKNG